MTEKQYKDRLDALGLEYPGDAPNKLLGYHNLLTEWNQKINLTADMDEDEALDKLYVDSVAPLTLDIFPKNARLIDVGSGAGFPGLPLAILRPDLRVTLLDSLQKRIGFLDAVIQALSLGNVSTLHARAEDAAHRDALRESYDVATARAVAALPTLLELLLPFVKIGGSAIGYKGPQAESELPAARVAARALGGDAPRILPVILPGREDWRHCVALCVKKEKTVRQYPRQAGTPAKKPLGGEAIKP